MSRREVMMGGDKGEGGINSTEAAGDILNCTQQASLHFTFT
jgi:hypothetical protein